MLFENRNINTKLKEEQKYKEVTSDFLHKEYKKNLKLNTHNRLLSLKGHLRESTVVFDL